MTDLVHIMQAHFRKLALDFDLRYSAEQVSHSGERGKLLEEALSSFLTAVLPTRIGIGSGQIVGALEKKPSRQIDIVLYDALNFPALLKEKSFQLFIAESVLVAIEVKSTLNKAELTKAFATIESAKRPRKFPDGKHPHSLGVLFCYKTSWKTPRSLRKALQEHARSSPATTPDMICCMEPGFIIAATNSLGVSVTNMGTLLAGNEKETTFPPDKFVLIEPAKYSKEHLLLWFYILLIDYLNRSLNIGITMSQYVRSSTVWSTALL